MAEQSTTKSILVVQTAFLGDLLLSIPLLKNIRAMYPQHELHLLTREGLGSMMQELGVVDHFSEIKKGDGDSYQKIIQQLKAFHFEKIYCPHQSWRSAILVSRLKAKNKVGFRTWWNFLFFTDLIVRNIRLPDALRQLSLLRNESQELAKKLDTYSQKNSLSHLAEVPDWASMSLRQKIKSSTELPEKKSLRVAIFPGSVWPTKQWTLEGFIQVSKHYRDQQAEVILLGGPDEIALAEHILQATPGIKSLVGKTKLVQTLAILKDCDLVISNDSGGQHLAAVADVPTISIFGPTVLSLGYRPWNDKAKVVEIAGMSCRPCGKHGHKKCPIGTHACMKEISAELVIQAATLTPYIPSH